MVFVICAFGICGFVALRQAQCDIDLGLHLDASILRQAQHGLASKTDNWDLGFLAIGEDLIAIFFITL